MKAFHITHEAIRKVGGIGAVLNGLLTTGLYKEKTDETFLIGPLFNPDTLFEDIGETGKVLYSPIHGVNSEKYQNLLSSIEEEYGVKIAIIERLLQNEFDPTKSNNVLVAAIYVPDMLKEKVDFFKYLLWEHFSIDSRRFENIWDYEQYLRIGVVYPQLVSIFAGYEPAIHWGHEYMGVPALLSVEIERRNGRRKEDITIFHAHEVAPARNIVEGIQGHDISFYNILKLDVKEKISMEDEFGSLDNHYRATLIKQESAFDYIFAVGDFVKEEYNYLVPQVNSEKIKVVYNGAPLRKIDMQQKLSSRRKIEEFCKNAFGYTPDVIFTHVARLVVSKGIWRDLKVLYHLDDYFYEHGLKGCYILLSSLIVTGREIEDVKKMESYGWPLIHREGWPDLVDIEIPTYHSIKNFNINSLSIKGIFINQFGFSREKVGNLIPEDAEFDDLRIAADVEFGQSVYEPFGIAQLEVIPFGGISVLSSACGSAWFLKNFLKDGKDFYYIFDYINIDEDLKSRFTTREQLKSITIQDRDLLEDRTVKKGVKKLFDLIVKNIEKNKLPPEEVIHQLDWENVAKNIFLNLPLPPLS